MKISLRALGASLVALAFALQSAQANFTVTQGSGTTFFSFDTATGGTSNCGANECYADVMVNTAGAPIGVSGTPWFVTGSGGTFPVTGSVTANAGTNLNTSLLALETGGNLATTATNTGTIAGAVSASVMQGNLKQVNGVTTLAGAGATGTGSQRETVAQDTTTIAGSAPGTAGSASGNVVTVQGVASMTALLANPGTIATWGLAPVAAGSAPTNMQVGGLIYNSSPLTPTTGQSLALQGDANGYLEVNVKAGGGSGGTSSSFSATFPSTGTAAGAEYLSSPPTLTTGQMVALQVTAAGSLHSTIDNANANGQTTMSASSPVTISSDQSAVATKAASGAFASGSLASGALAAGSISSGAAVSGAFVAGSIADLAHGQGAMAASVPMVIASNQSAEAAWGQGATGAAAPSGATQLGVTSSGATGGFMRGEIMCDNHTFKHITSATDTLAVQGVASQTVYVCGWRARAAGTATWYLENTASTNANCSSTLTQITGVATEAANTGEVAYNPIWGGMKNTSANGLCINSTGTGGVDVDIWYTQL